MSQTIECHVTLLLGAGTLSAGAFGVVYFLYLRVCPENAYAPSSRSLSESWYIFFLYQATASSGRSDDVPRCGGVRILHTTGKR